MSVLFYFFLAVIAGFVYFLHEMVHEKLFLKSIKVERFSWLAIGLTCLILNFTFFTLGYLLPFRALLETFLPPVRVAETFIPVSLAEIFQSPYYVGAIFLIATPGPVVVFCYRWIRRTRPKVGGRLFEAFQVLAYLAVFIVALSKYFGAPSGVPFLYYQNILLIVLLPPSIGGFAVLLALANKRFREKWLPWLT